MYSSQIVLVHVGEGVAVQGVVVCFLATAIAAKAATARVLEMVILNVILNLLLEY